MKGADTIIPSGYLPSCHQTPGFLALSKKLSLDGIFVLNQRLHSGEAISDIFDLAPLRPFFAHIFGATKQQEHAHAATPQAITPEVAQAATSQPPQS